MSKSLDVHRALIALAATALPAADVVGLDLGAEKPARLSPLGRVAIWRTDPGDAQIDLSPLSYNYDHPFLFEVEATDTVALDAMLAAIGAAIEAARHLGGLCDWVEPQMPGFDQDSADGTATIASCGLIVIASYATSNPLT